MIKRKATSFIRYFQRRLKVDLFYILRGEFWLMSGRGINLAVSFLVALAWANWISPDIYGNYQFILSVIAIISVFSLPELGTAVTRSVARGNEGDFIKSYQTQLKWGSLASLASLTIAGYYFSQSNSVLSLSFLSIALFLPVFNAALIYSNFLNGKKDFKIMVRYDALTQIFACLIMIAALFTAKTYFAALATHWLLLFIVSTYYLSRTALRYFFFVLTKNRYKPNKKTDKLTISYGKHLTFTGFIGTLSEHLDKILLFHYLGAVQVAVYAFAMILPKQMRVFLNHLGALSLPKFSQRTKQYLKKTFMAKLYYLAGLISFGVAVYIIVAPWLYKLFFPTYTDAIAYSQVYAISIIPLTFSMISGVFKAQMMTKEIYTIRIVGPIVKIALSVLLIPFYGIWGAVLAVLFSRSINVGIYMWLFKKM